MPDHADILRAVESSERRTAQSLTEIKRELDEIKEGFPGGDPCSHRRYHESIIEWRETRTKFIRDTTAQIVRAGILGGLAWAVYGFWVLIKMEFQK